MKNDSLGDRMKSNYEDRFRVCLPRRANVIIRLDGVAFHTYMRGAVKPYDLQFMTDMEKVTCHLCENIMGAKLAFTQSDEITLWLTDYDKITTEAWFDNNVQKMCSVAASMATAKFNSIRPWSKGLAYFDARVFVVPEITEVHNMFLWRQEDCVRNSVQMLGQSEFSHKQLHGLSCEKIKEKLWEEKNMSWESQPSRCKHGAVVHKVEYSAINPIDLNAMVTRTRWEVDFSYPVFKERPDYVPNLAPGQQLVPAQCNT